MRASIFYTYVAQLREQLCVSVKVLSLRLLHVRVNVFPHVSYAVLLLYALSLTTIYTTVV